MKNGIGSFHLIIFCCLLFSVSCVQSNQKKEGIFKTQSGKTFEVIVTHPNGISLSDIRVIPSGFEFGRDQELLDVDPISFVQLADLDNDGFEELFIITNSAGSGSYGNIYGFHSNRDRSVSPIYIREISEKDKEKGNAFEGYMGHDKFILSDNTIARSFPIYLENDTNNHPSGGTRIIIYQLVKGEASVILEIVNSDINN